MRIRIYEEDFPPYQKHSETSLEAAEEIDGQHLTLRARVWTWLLEEGPATDQELQDALGMDAHTECPRRIELVRHGWVRDSGDRRLTRSGRRAVVWEVIPRSEV